MLDRNELVPSSARIVERRLDRLEEGLLRSDVAVTLVDPVMAQARDGRRSHRRAPERAAPGTGTEEEP